jgi:hypothetical protein
MEYGISGAPSAGTYHPLLERFQQPEASETLSVFGPRHRVLFFYQHWCPMCHSHGFPGCRGSGRQIKRQFPRSSCCAAGLA